MPKRPEPETPGPGTSPLCTSVPRGELLAWKFLSLKRTTVWSRCFTFACQLCSASHWELWAEDWLTLHEHQTADPSLRALQLTARMAGIFKWWGAPGDSAIVPHPIISFLGFLPGQQRRKLSWQQEQPMCLLLSSLSGFTPSLWGPQQEEESQDSWSPWSCIPTSV